MRSSAPTLRRPGVSSRIANASEKRDTDRHRHGHETCASSILPHHSTKQAIASKKKRRRRRKFLGLSSKELKLAAQRLVTAVSLLIFGLLCVTTIWNLFHGTTAVLVPIFFTTRMRRLKQSRIYYPTSVHLDLRGSASLHVPKSVETVGGENLVLDLSPDFGALDIELFDSSEPFARNASSDSSDDEGTVVKHKATDDWWYYYAFE